MADDDNMSVVSSHVPGLDDAMMSDAAVAKAAQQHDKSVDQCWGNVARQTAKVQLKSGQLA